MSSEEKQTERISVYPRANATTPDCDVALEQIADLIRTSTSRTKKILAELAQLRAASRRETDEYRALKATLTGVTFAGRFDERRAAGLQQHSGHLVLDFDHVDDADALRDRLFEHPAVALAFVSPSQDGCKAVVAVAPTPSSAAEHRYAFEQAAARFSEIAAIDSSGRDVSRLCFLTHDPDCCYRADAIPITWEPPAPQQTAPPPRPEPRGQDAGLAAAIDRALALIPADDYETWLQIGQALHAGGHPLELWDSWSRASDKYEADACASKWAGFGSDRGITMGTFWHLAKDHGYQTKSAAYAATRSWAKSQSTTPTRDAAASYAREWNQRHGATLSSDEARDAGRNAARDDEQDRAENKRGEFTPPDLTNPGAVWGQGTTIPADDVVSWQLRRLGRQSVEWHLELKGGREIVFTSLGQRWRVDDALHGAQHWVRDAYTGRAAWRQMQHWLLRSAEEVLVGSQDHKDLVVQWIRAWMLHADTKRLPVHSRPRLRPFGDGLALLVDEQALIAFLDYRSLRRYSDNAVRMALFNAKFQWYDEVDNEGEGEGAWLSTAKRITRLGKLKPQVFNEEDGPAH